MEHAHGLSPAPATGTDIAVELEHSIGFAGAVFDGQHYHPNGRDYVYSAGACVGELWLDTLAVLQKHYAMHVFAVICDFTDPHNQHFLRGHNGNVTCLALSPSVRPRVICKTIFELRQCCVCAGSTASFWPKRGECGRDRLGFSH